MLKALIRSIVTLRSPSDMIRRIFAAGLLAMTYVVCAAPAYANHPGTRYITINGQRLNHEQVVQADRNVGYRLRDGHYWWNLHTGYWGVVGGPPLGHVPPPPAGDASQRQGGGLGPLFDSVIDPSGGCEGGSCVNIIERW